jgi:hypothetical protein
MANPGRTRRRTRVIPPPGYGTPGQTPAEPKREPVAPQVPVPQTQPQREPVPA